MTFATCVRSEIHSGVPGDISCQQYIKHLIYKQLFLNSCAGGVFDPLGLSAKPADFADLQVKEIKNGRLALVAWVGFAAQAAVTRKGPVADLLDFAADPIHNNIFAYFK